MTTPRSRRRSSPARLLSDVATSDPDWQHHLDGVDVMFTRRARAHRRPTSSRRPTRARSTTACRSTNETGLDIRDQGHPILRTSSRRGCSTLRTRTALRPSIYLTVPSMPNDVARGAELPAHRWLSWPSRPSSSSGNKPVKAHPDDRSRRPADHRLYIPSTRLPLPTAAPPATYIPLPDRMPTASSRGASADRRRLDIPKQPRRQRLRTSTYEFRWKGTAELGHTVDQLLDPTVALPSGFHLQVHDRHRRSTGACRLTSRPTRYSRP